MCKSKGSQSSFLFTLRSTGILLDLPRWRELWFEHHVHFSRCRLKCQVRLIRVRNGIFSLPRNASWKGLSSQIWLDKIVFVNSGSVALAEYLTRLSVHKYRGFWWVLREQTFKGTIKLQYLKRVQFHNYFGAIKSITNEFVPTIEVASIHVEVMKISLVGWNVFFPPCYRIIHLSIFVLMFFFSFPTGLASLFNLLPKSYCKF